MVFWYKTLNKSWTKEISKLSQGVGEKAIAYYTLEPILVALPTNPSECSNKVWSRKVGKDILVSCMTSLRKCSMGLVRITSRYPEFNGRHFGLPPSTIHRMTALGGKWCELWRIRTNPIERKCAKYQGLGLSRSRVKEIFGNEHIETAHFMYNFVQKNQCIWAVRRHFIPTMQLKIFTQFSPEHLSEIEL